MPTSTPLRQLRQLSSEEHVRHGYWHEEQTDPDRYVFKGQLLTQEAFDRNI
jgi:hypothetical protein